MTIKRYQKANKTAIKKKDIPLDTNIIIVNGTGLGGFFYSHERIEHVIDLQEPTSYEQKTLADLKIISQFSRNIFSEYGILIVDVLDEEYTLKDIYAYLDLMPVYDELMLMAKNEDEFDTGMFERFAIKSSVKVFTKTIMGMTVSAQKRLIQALFHAYKDKTISDTQAGWDKVTLVASQILNMSDDVIDVLKNDYRRPSIHINDLI
ncbi:hypothetical protein [Priestia megaterium]|uniref:hypothetical protein n=1 Tax=Priestia megaterium TaxID=1404 RepID=UPI002E243FAB|nr:hypothetical protein [Priestia megaterium]